MANEVDGCYCQVGFCCPYWAVFKVTSEGEDTYVESGITKYRRIPNANSFKEECCNEVHKLSKLEGTSKIMRRV